MTSTADSLIFPDGNKMPIVGLGTWQASDAEVDAAISAALDAGYRHIDTAYVYMNEAAIGRALKKWIDSGKVKREDLFIVTKLPNFGNKPENVEKYIKKSLEALQTNYLDLYLVHHPVGLLEKGDEMLPRDDAGNLLLDMNTDIVSVWKAMEAQVDSGRTRSIGLSNFNSRQIARIVEAARIRPANLQVELHVYFQQRELVAFCKALGITVCAYAPIGSPGLASFVKMIGDNDEKIPKLSPLTDPVIVRIAEKHNKTPAQVLLRHIIQRGIAVIPKSSNPTRIKQNFQEYYVIEVYRYESVECCNKVFDFNLNEEEVDQLDALDKGRKGRLFGQGMLAGLDRHPEYPYSDPY